MTIIRAVEFMPVPPEPVTQDSFGLSQSDKMFKAVDLSILELLKYDHKIEKNRKGDNIRKQFFSMYEVSFAQETKNNLSEQAEQVLRINAMDVNEIIDFDFLEKNVNEAYNNVNSDDRAFIDDLCRVYPWGSLIQ